MEKGGRKRHKLFEIGGSSRPTLMQIRNRLGLPSIGILLLVTAVLWQSAVGQTQRSKKPVPSRIITIAPNAAETICALGQGGRIVGVSKFCVYPAELAERPRIGGLFDPELEAIVSLRPDLIVLRGRCESVEQLCAERGIRVHHDRTESLDDIRTSVLAIGELLDRTREAERVVASFDRAIAAVRHRIAGKKKPRVFITMARDPDRPSNILTSAKGTFLHDAVEVAGGINVFGHLDIPYPQVSPEGIAATRPDVIIEMFPELKLTEQREKQLRDQWSSLSMIPAVTTGRVYFITDENAQIPSPRFVEIIEKLSLIFHPVPSDE